MKIFKLLLLSIFIIIAKTSFSCDEASVTIANIVDNGDGTYTITYNMCVEFNGLEGAPEGWAFNYNNPNSILIQSFSPATINSSDGDVYTGAIYDGNCDAQSDPVYGPCDGVDNVLQYYFPGFLPTNSSNTLCFSVTMTIVGYPTSVDVVMSVDETVYASCTQTIIFPLLPLCSISSVLSGAQTPCVPASNTYTQQITVFYNNDPGSGTLDVNGQSFAITSSPQTVTLTNLPADGNSVNVTAVFSDDAGCTLTSAGLFNAPASCSAPCAPDNGTWD